MRREATTLLSPVPVPDDKRATEAPQTVPVTKYAMSVSGKSKPKSKPKPETKAIVKARHRRVPTYAADGTRLRDYTAHAIQHLFSLSMVVVRRNRRGLFVFAQFRTMSEGNPLMAAAVGGTRYSYQQHVHEVKVWSHRKLVPITDAKDAEAGGARIDPEEARRWAVRVAETRLRRIFSAVPISCLTAA